MKMSEKIKKAGAYKKGLLVYVAILLVVIVSVDVYVWSKLSEYEKTMTAKDMEQTAGAITGADDITGSQNGSAQGEGENVTVTPKPSNTPGPTKAPMPETRTVWVEIPTGVTVKSDGEVLDFSAQTPVEVTADEFDLLYSFSETYSEYANIQEKVDIPVMYRYEIELQEGAVLSAENENSETVELVSTTGDDGTVSYRCGFLNDTGNYDTISALAFEAIEKYALFCTNDADASEMKQYFPDNSEYYKTISSMDNSWYMKHSGLPVFSEKKVLDYKGYSDSLVYIEISMKQTILSSVTGAYVDTEISHPIWFVKLDGEWKIGAIDF